MRRVILPIIFGLTILSADLVEFQSGGIIKAEEMNGNFQFLENGIESVRTQITQIDNNRSSSLEIRVNNLEQTTSNFTANQNQVYSFEKNISNNQSKIESLETSLFIVKSNNVDLQNKVKTLETSILNAKDSISELETKNSNLKAIVDKIDIDLILSLSEKIQDLENVLYPKKDNLNNFTNGVVTYDGAFVRNYSSQTVTDNSTGLMYSDEVRTLQKMTSSKAQSLCSKLTLGGFNNWTLPSKIEIQAVNGENIFQNKEDGKYWIKYGYGYSYYSVNWSDGKYSSENKSNLLYVICVRSLIE